MIDRVRASQPLVGLTALAAAILLLPAGMAAAAKKVPTTVKMTAAHVEFSASSVPSDCLLGGSQWVLFKDSTSSTPIAFGEFNAVGNPWQHDYESQPPSLSEPAAGGDLDVTGCFSATAEVTV